MSVISTRRSRALAGAAVAALLCSGLAACSDAVGTITSGGDDAEHAEGAEQPEGAAPVRVSTNVKQGATVPVDQELRVRARGGELRSVRLVPQGGKPVKGRLSGNGSSWRFTDGLEPGTSYTLRTVAENADGEPKRTVRRFQTDDLTLDEQTYASIAPLEGETVGVGMPVVVNFDLPVENRAAFERHMSVTSSPKQPGTWHWVSDTQVRWRPKTYWKPGTDVHVDVDVNSLPAGNGIYGQESRSVDFTIGDAVITKVNINTHQMKVYRNGKLLRTMPTTTGRQPEYTTRSGVKVIMGKTRYKDMNSASIGIDPESADGYDLSNVEYAMRITTSGEFIHAAPWSVGSQGVANVSHGCTGLSTANAGWLYNLAKRGDVVEFTGSDRGMTVDNGYGDWNESFREYAQGSALR